MDDVILLFLYLAVIAGAFLIGGAITFVIEAIRQEWL